MNVRGKKISGAGWIGRAVLYGFMLVFLMLILFPFIWMVLGSFKSVRELFAVPLAFWPASWSLRNYIEAFEAQPFWKYLLNSMSVSGISTAVVALTASLASYALARTPVRGKKIVLILVLTVSLLPPVTLINPIYQMYSAVGLLNTRIGLSMILAAVEMPTAIWLMTSYFQSVPFELEESAMIDGASVPRVFVSIMIPLVAPGIFTVGIMTFITAWNNYIFASVLNQHTTARTIPVALTLFETESYTPWHLICAAAVIVSLPLVCIVMMMQKRIVSGVMSGSVKG